MRALHDHLSPTSTRTLISDYLNHRIVIDEKEVAGHRKALAAGLSRKGLLARVASDTGHQFNKIGEVAEPIAGEIYGIVLPRDGTG